jgi:hypothetical protein
MDPQGLMAFPVLRWSGIKTKGWRLARLFFDIHLDNEFLRL